MNYKLKYYKHLGLDKCDILQCANCGAVASQIHHIKYRSKGGTDDFDNLIHLCFKCHSGHHTQNKPTTEELERIKLSYLF